MATMHALFFGLLFTAVCGIVDPVDDPVTQRSYGRDVGLRYRIIRVASAEIGVREATGNNDGKRVAEYLDYTGLGAGYAWCAAFVSWCYGQAGLGQPRNPWSPALFPKEKVYCEGTGCARSATLNRVRKADVFGIYGQAARRIIHVGLVKERQGKYLITVEGNSDNQVDSRRRHLATVYALADWIGGES